MGNKIDPLEVIELIQPKIKKLLYQTSIGNREDLEQELNLLIKTSMKKIKFKNLPSFSKLISLIEQGKKVS
ncbi:MULTISPECIES: hypothetical protein [Lysinibacillus]|uniref:hypothetical protein n=1 Tax=Lysinibacillus TaxID=400634 RepID=UPI00214CD8AD|nr:MULTISPECIES: hypothetical protein [Lysinibacillus]UUV27164.1 hypothetical protein NP781_11660 [Lysinibacillus sp. FN11]UYB45431.1 hypothetical protein OCI51_14310 [Lysinibacillus capsici]